MAKQNGGTGKPDPTKDRSAHEAARGRGQKKPSLRDLSRIHNFDERVQDMLHELDNQTDRGAALIAAAMVDVALGRCMRCRLLYFDNCVDVLFENEGAPLGTFSARIKMARGLGVIGPLTESHLNSVRRVRNQFAHSPLKIDFTNELIAAEIDKLLPDNNPSWHPEWTTQRRRYIGTASLIMSALETRTEQHINDTHDLWLT